jgi:hypothetical protein
MAYPIAWNGRNIPEIVAVGAIFQEIKRLISSKMATKGRF